MRCGRLFAFLAFWTTRFDHNEYDLFLLTRLGFNGNLLRFSGNAATLVPFRKASNEVLGMQHFGYDQHHTTALPPPCCYRTILILLIAFVHQKMMLTVAIQIYQASH